MTYSQILACGAFGGICPSIAKLASTYSTDPTTPMPIIGAYIAMGLFAILGAGIALGFGAREVKAAIIAGIAAPGIVTNVVAGAQEREQTLPDPLAMSFFATPAFAQTTEAELILAEATGRILTVVPQISGGEIGAGGLDLRFETASGMTLPGTTLYGGTTPQVQVVVPEGATTLVVGSAKFPMDADAIRANVDIMTSPTLGGDLLWALGGKRSYAVGEISVTFQE